MNLAGSSSPTTYFLFSVTGNFDSVSPFFSPPFYTVPLASDLPLLPPPSSLLMLSEFRRDQKQASIVLVRAVFQLIFNSAFTGSGNFVRARLLPPPLCFPFPRRTKGVEPPLFSFFAALLAVALPFSAGFPGAFGSNMAPRPSSLLFRVRPFFSFHAVDCLVYGAFLPFPRQVVGGSLGALLSLDFPLFSPYSNYSVIRTLPFRAHIF